jgi:hypothetical protein
MFHLKLDHFPTKRQTKYISLPLPKNGRKGDKLITLRLWKTQHAYYLQKERV